MNIKVGFSELKNELETNLKNEKTFKANSSNAVYVRGATFTPSVSSDGTLSWSNDKGLTNPSPVNIKGDKGDKGDKGATGANGKDGTNGVDGKDGLNGKDGYTPVKGIDYFDGKDGKNGTNGTNGKDGYTPVKGTDYFTESEKAEFIKSIIVVLPIEIGQDYVEISHQHLTLSSDKLHLYANQSANSVIEILAGENDETSFYISPNGLNVTANNGNIDFRGSNGINFTTGAEGLSWFTFYDNEQFCYFGIELNDQSTMFSFNYDKENGNSNLYCDANTIDFAQSQEVKVNNVTVNNNAEFLGTVDFANAKVIGLNAGGLTQEQVQEMINTAINGALEEDY